MNSFTMHVSVRATIYNREVAQTIKLTHEVLDDGLGREMLVNKMENLANLIVDEYELERNRRRNKEEGINV